MTTGAASGVAPSAGWLGRFYGSVIGKKVVMALTGIVMVGFVTVHMSGNLLAYKSAASLDAYAAFLKSSAVVLWGTRLILLGSVVLHVHAAFSLSRLAAKARPSRYAALHRQASTWSARVMRTGGVVLAAFIVFHILHFTTGTILPSRFVEGGVYGNVLQSFSIAWVAAFYVVAMVALAFHLHHGVWSVFQTLGASHPNLRGARRGLALLLAVAIPLGFVAVPLGVAFGLLR